MMNLQREPFIVHHLSFTLIECPKVKNLSIRANRKVSKLFKNVGNIFLVNKIA
jgi:hypothetical protein